MTLILSYHSRSSPNSGFPPDIERNPTSTSVLSHEPGDFGLIRLRIKIRISAAVPHDIGEPLFVPCKTQQLQAGGVELIGVDDHLRILSLPRPFAGKAVGGSSDLRCFS